MDDWEKEWRKNFYRINGKTPEQESVDSLRAVLVWIVAGLLSAGLAFRVLIAYLG